MKSLEDSDNSLVEEYDDIKSNLKENLMRISKNKGYKLLLEYLNSIEKERDSMLDEIENVRDRLYSVIYLSTSKKRHSISDICTIRDGGVYEYNESFPLSFITFFDNYEEIKSEIIRLCKESKKSDLIDILNNVSSMEKSLVFADERIRQMKTLRIEASNVPKPNRPEIPKSTEDSDYYIQIDFNQSGRRSHSGLTKLYFYYSIDGERPDWSSFYETVILKSEIEDFDIKELMVLSYHIGIIIDNLNNFKDRIEKAEEIGESLSDKITKKFAKELVVGEL